MTQIGFGIFCSNSNGSLSTNHTFKLQNLTIDRLLRTVNLNIKDFLSLLNLCKKENIEVFRLGSSFIPFASHKNFKESWFFKIETILKEVKDAVKDFSIRITMHPGQFVVLNSPNKNVLENSIRELEYHFWLLDVLNIPDDGVIIVHIGGVYENKEKSIERFINVIEKNAWLKRRLAIENDERHYNSKDVLYISKQIKVPFVFDYFHHKINPSEIDLTEVFKTWFLKGVPKVHLSSQGKGKIGNHGDYVNIEDFLDLKKIIEKTNIEKVHIMLEAKKKELALKKLRKEIR
ncbi:MAG: UV DNA damage repair endonuclease UvsE [Candidatus Kryptonium sp.]